MTNIKKKVLIFILLLISSLIFIGIFMGLKTFHDTMYAIFPSMRQEFHYSTEPISLTILPGTKWEAKYKIPKAYFNSKILYEKNGGASVPIRLWASYDDDMAPWTLSETFKRRERKSLIHVYIYPGFAGEGKKQFPYHKINRSKKRGGGINRGKYKELFTRYDDTSTLGRITEDGTREKKLFHFFLIPKEEDFFIKCIAIGNPDNSKCTVSKAYKDNISYEFLIPHRIIERYRQYDKKVQELIDRLYQPSKEEQNESK